MAETNSPKKSSGLSDYAPMVVGAILMFMLTGAFIGLIFGIFSSLRFLGLGGALNFAGLRSIGAGETVFVTFYYPGWKSSDEGMQGNCETFSGVIYAYRHKTTQEIVQYCKLPDEERRPYQTDDNYELVSSFEGGKYATGGIAVNNPIFWPEGAAWPLTADKSAQVRQGTSYWLQIPGYTSEPAPVVDTFGTATDVHESRYEEMRAVGQDMKKRLDLAAKGPEDAAAALSRMNCQGGISGLYSCRVSDVTVYHGNAFTGGLKQVGGGGNATAAEGAFTGDPSVVDVKQSLAIPDRYLGDPGMNTVYAKPTHIVLHYLATAGMDARKAQEYFVNTLKNTDHNDNKYVQYTINRNGDIYQFLPETKKAAGACGFNSTPNGGVSISIENEGHFESGIASQNYTTAQVESNAKLVKYLQEKWNIPTENIISHGDARQLGFDAGVRKANGEPCDARSDPGSSFMSAVKSKL